MSVMTKFMKRLIIAYSIGLWLLVVVEYQVIDILVWLYKSLFLI
jgi:hypothetical protein